MENFPQKLRGLERLRITPNPNRNRKQCTDITLATEI